ncbi:hypothetical protein [Sporosarcina ureae]|uniref:hypothetical protein n=1 Tax=Sporosarcina ureae TaxID=1571 RepID=UPI000A17F3DF|nr:hypothetical protein [Sporosarcina ureae]ARK20769.1 hypothetical protein SporoP32a_03875 [Sporosarcina ureae]
MKRFISAIIAAIFFAIIYSAISYVPESQREPNTYYFGYAETMVFVMLYAGPIFLLIGIPLSIMIDKLMKNKKSQYVKKLVFYSVAGLLIGALFPLILLPGLNSVSLIVLYAGIGLMAANIYFHTLLLLPPRNNISINKET